MENGGELEKTDFENGRISNFQRHVTLTVTLDLAIWHTVVHHSSTSTVYLHIKFHSNRINFFLDGRTYVRLDGQTSRPALLGRLGGVDLKLMNKLT